MHFIPSACIYVCGQLRPGMRMRCALCHLAGSSASAVDVLRLLRTFLCRRAGGISNGVVCAESGTLGFCVDCQWLFLHDGNEVRWWLFVLQQHLQDMVKASESQLHGFVCPARARADTWLLYGWDGVICSHACKLPPTQRVSMYGWGSARLWVVSSRQQLGLAWS